jgi:hypothetical protein
LRLAAIQIDEFTSRPGFRLSPLWVCAVIRRRFPVGVNPTRQMLQPEATGAATEVTNWLKPSDSVSRIGDSASVQAATRVNAEQALYGAFEVKHLFHTLLHFLHSSFFVRLGIPFLRPDPQVGAVKVGRRSALAARSVVSRPRLDRPEHGGTVVVVGTTIRGELAIGRGSSRHNLVFGRSVTT